MSDFVQMVKVIFFITRRHIITPNSCPATSSQMSPGDSESSLGSLLGILSEVMDGLFLVSTSNRSFTCTSGDVLWSFFLYFFFTRRPSCVRNEFIHDRPASQGTKIWFWSSLAYDQPQKNSQMMLIPCLFPTWNRENLRKMLLFSPIYLTLVSRKIIACWLMVAPGGNIPLRQQRRQSPPHSAATTTRPSW